MPPNKSMETEPSIPGFDGLPVNDAQPVLGDDYRIERILGRGGVGTVYLVRQLSGERRLYALKTLHSAVSKNLSIREALLREIRTWIDLPEHLNLTRCLFFRTFQGKMCIFSEYVNGGSLQEWIATRRLLEVPDILAVAIRTAWGLFAAHSAAVIHQDIKPSNILMTRDGIPKITDFGMARIRPADCTDPSGADNPHPGLVSAEGLTPAYCSPEQARGKLLGPKTDMWSWALSVMQMFTGSVIWKMGFLGASILDRFNGQQRFEPYPAMPPALQALLNRCLQENPEDRPVDMDQVSRELQEIYRQVTGQAFDAVPPPILQLSSAPLERTASSGVSWDDPVVWLEKAQAAAGQPAGNRPGAVTIRGSSRRAQSVADLEIYQRALDLYRRVVDSDASPRIPEYAELLINAAYVYDTIGDTAGAIQLYDDAILWLNRSRVPEQRSVNLDLMAYAYNSKAIILKSGGSVQAALPMYDRAIQCREALLDTDDSPGVRDHLATVCMNKANALRQTGETPASLTALDRAIEIWNSIQQTQPSLHRWRTLALAHMNRGNALGDLGRDDEALVEFQTAVQLGEEIVYSHGMTDFSDDLGKIYLNTAAQHHMIEQFSEALDIYRKARLIWEKQVFDRDRWDLARHLVSLYMNIGLANDSLGRMEAAIEQFDEAITLQKNLIENQGLSELYPQLADLYVNKGATLSSAGQLQAALSIVNKAVALYKNMISRKRQTYLLGPLGRAYSRRAEIHRNLGDAAAAHADWSRAAHLLDKEYRRTGNIVHRSELEKLKHTRDNIVSEQGGSSLGTKH